MEASLLSQCFKVEDSRRSSSLSFVTVFQCFSNNSSLTVFIILEGPHKIFMRHSNKLRNAIDIVMLIKVILNCV